MAIRTVITRGYGNGIFNGTIALLALHGFASGAVISSTLAGLGYTLNAGLTHYILDDNLTHYTMPPNKMHYTMRDEN